MSIFVRSNHFLVIFVLHVCAIDIVSGGTCYYTATRQERSSYSCGFLWLSTCYRYRRVQYTKAECCSLWTGPSCSLPICEDLSISNGDVVISETTDGISATYSCETHYQLTGGDGVRYCQTDGEWDGQQPYCAYMNSCNSSPCLNGGVCSNGPNTFTCSCTRAWSGTRCEINVVDCGHPVEIKNGNVAVPNTNYGSRAVYSCNAHYNMTSGDSISTCQMDFTWSGTKPTCTFVNTCGSNPCQNSGTCINGLNQYTCICAPGWSGSNCENDIQPPVLKECPNMLHKNATDRTQMVFWDEPAFEDPFGNTIDIKSNYPQPEFQFPWGDFTVQYVATKVNNGLSVECTFNISVRPTPCEELNIPQNGARICNGWKTDYGRVCLLACKQNYTIPPSHSYKQLYVCGASGHWIFPGPLPDCSVSVESQVEALIYHPTTTVPSMASCDDGSIKQYYVDVLSQAGDLSAYCHKYPDDCHQNNVAVACG